MLKSQKLIDQNIFSLKYSNQGSVLIRLAKKPELDSATNPAVEIAVSAPCSALIDALRAACQFSIIPFFIPSVYVTLSLSRFLSIGYTVVTAHYLKAAFSRSRCNIKLAYNIDFVIIFLLFTFVKKCELN